MLCCRVVRVTRVFTTRSLNLWERGLPAKRPVHPPKLQTRTGTFAGKLRSNGFGANLGNRLANKFSPAWPRSIRHRPTAERRRPDTRVEKK